MTEVQSVPADKRLTLTGNLIVTLSPVGGQHTYYRLNRDTAGELYIDLLNMFLGDGRGVERVTLQYVAGPSGNEAGSRFFDLDTDEPLPHDDDRAELVADTVLGYLLEIEAGFRRGLRFVP